MNTAIDTFMRSHSKMPSYEKGLTLVELLVALVLSSIVSLAVIALYSTTASTYRTNDANQELQDTARFVMDVISQQIKLAGLQDQAQSAFWNKALVAQSMPVALASWDNLNWGNMVFGANNSTIATPGNVNSNGVDGSGGYNSSDVLGVRFFGSSLLTDNTKPDSTVIDCQGFPQNYPITVGDVAYSIFWVKSTGTADGEPELHCISRGNPVAGTLNRATQPIARGVESFQVMYSVDAGSNSAPDRWLDAQEVTAAAAWPTVRMVRVGFILRGAPGSGTVQQPTMYPMGDEFSKVSGSASTVNGMFFTPPNDGRLRKAFTLQVTLRNS
jgi:type IV pilus assembly protein PilW